MANTPCKNMKIYGRSWGTFRLFRKKRMHDVVLLREFSSILKTNLSLQEYQEDECKSLIEAQ